MAGILRSERDEPFVTASAEGGTPVCLGTRRYWTHAVPIPSLNASLGT